VKCPKCGTVCPDKDKACEFCGVDFTEARAQQAAEAARAAAHAAAAPAAPAAPVAPGAAQAAPDFSASPAAAPGPGAPPAPAAPAAAPEIAEGAKPCAACGRGFDHHAMKLIAGRLYCPECEVKLVQMAAAGAGAEEEGAPPGMIACAGCGRPKSPDQLKEIGGVLYCVNCEIQLVASFQGGSGSAPAAKAGPKAQTGEYTPREITEEEIAERQESRRIIEEQKRREKEKEEARRILSRLTRWPEVTLPPELVPPKDLRERQERPAPEIPEKAFGGTGATRLIWGPVVLALLAIAIFPRIVDIGPWGVFVSIVCGLGVLVGIYFFIDSFASVRINTQGIWKDSKVARKRIFWSSMRSVELVQEAAFGLKFLAGFYSKLELHVTTGDGRMFTFPFGSMMGKPCVKKFDEMKKHFKTGALANSVNVIERTPAGPAGPAEPAEPPQE